ncbi:MULTISPECIES: flagellar hook-associated protein FlgK [unclassified Brevundimonas]|uniref:flagellar hook-associated protein FlgK n=1 Tax=unclassified Brevundimonas TaxID=2622653 RepID=UPI0025C6886D|nr:MULTISPECIES: flagellar hook-associated protein FlgK [unclassified Brevundimonas]
MSLNLIMNIATSGMNTAQSQLRVVSDNVTNINTPGYVRKIADQQSLTTQGMGTGVQIARVRLATDRFLQASTLNTSADAARETVRYELFDRIQSLFGDPGGDSSFFTGIDDVFAAFAASAELPGSAAARQTAIWKTQNLFDQAADISRQIQAVREDADGRLQSSVDSINGLLDQISKLNREITRATVTGADATGAQNAQAQLIDQLSSFMDIRLSPQNNGATEIRTGAGLLLVGNEPAKLEYQRAGAISAQTSFGDIIVREPSGSSRSLTEGLVSGELKGLIQLRDIDAPQAAEQLAELTSKLADELNRAHNASSSVPAPAVMQGRNTGQTLETALSGFTGRTTLAVLNDSGVVQSRAEIVFNGANITINGVAATPATFLTVLNAQVPGVTASFANGALKLEAAGGNGLAIADDATAPSNKNGKGFSHYFGLNDLVSSTAPISYETGMTTASAHGFAAGQQLTFRFANGEGVKIRDIEFTVPAGGTMADLISALNDPVAGVGRHGTFSLSASGEMIFTGRGTPPAQMSVLNDRTAQNPSGVSMSQVFGLGGMRGARTATMSVRQDIMGDPTKLALSQLNLGVPAGSPAISGADGTGARLLAQAGNASTRFGPAGGVSGSISTLTRYASDMAGSIGAKANLRENAASSAEALYSTASARRDSFEGVNLEEELVLMTTFQQAFNASARLIQAASEMYDTLIGMVR